MAKGGGFNTLLGLSDELADFMGKDKATRAQVTKAVWDHIKKKKLQDPKDKRTIRPDAVLATILGNRPINMFKMTTKLSQHFL